MTPEEIKDGLEACGADECHGQHKSCPYKDDAFCMMHICSDALAYITQLEQHFDGVGKMLSKWISVKDRLPNPSTYVLALTAHGALSVGQNVIVADYIHPKDEERGVFVIAYTNYDDKDIVPVTHWMQLPEPPKEE